MLAEPPLAEPSFAEVSFAEPSLTEVSISEPSFAEPSLVEPSLVEPSLVEVSLAEHSFVEPSLVESSLVEVSLAEHSLVEPSLVEVSFAGSSTSDPDQVCVVCGSKGDLKVVKPQTFSSLKEAASIRRQYTSDKFITATRYIVNATDKSEMCYHSNCLKQFTAVKRKLEIQSSTTITRSQSDLPQTTERGILDDTCLFCGKKKRKWKGKEETLSACMTLDGSRAIIEIAKARNDERILSLLSTGIDLIAKECKYHRSCRQGYFNSINNRKVIINPDQSSRKCHANTFEIIAKHIEKEIFVSKRSVLMSTIFDLYAAEYVSNGGLQDDVDRYSVQSLTDKIGDRFKNKVSISLLDRRKGNILHDSSISETEAKASLTQNSDEYHLINKIISVALELRTLIKAMPKTKTPDHVSINTLKSSAPVLPEPVMILFRTLFQGLNTNLNDVVERKVMAMASDTVFNTTRGTVRPWKHTVTGLALSSITGSKTVCQVLNRCGHAISYDEVKSLETEMAYACCKETRETPDGMTIADDSLATGTAWDNYDVLLETLDGKNTLHATFGIAYQNKRIGPVPVEEYGFRDGRKRRRFDGIVKPIVPYWSNLKRAKFDLSLTETNFSFINQQTLDMFWLSQTLRKPMPLFPGYFSLFVVDELPEQVICYMDPISLPPTRNDVVKTTMERSLKVAAETNQEYGIVTYDLPVAIKAYCIQALEAPAFDQLLILLGSFHVELAFFGAVGTFIRESGIEFILTEAGVLAEGSVNGFVGGKFYNRCTRIHQILATVLEKSLYQRFLEDELTEIEAEELSTTLDTVSDDENKIEQLLMQSNIFRDHLRSYEGFFTSVMGGKLGPTAAFYAIYVYMINRVYRDFQRAVRMNNVDLYKDAMQQLLVIFFGLNRPNYARWGTLFLQKLTKLPPDCRHLLDIGAFSIRRTQKNYARTPIDLTLEQTINKDAASPMKGIVAFSNSDEAQRRWCITAHQRGMAVAEMRNLLQLEMVDYPAAQLRPNQIQKDNKSINDLTKTIQNACDPFRNTRSTSSQDLFNIATGKVASKKTEYFLLNVLKDGHDKSKQFVEECCERGKNRFQETVKRTKINSFATENSKGRSTGAKTNVDGFRDVFARILLIAAKSCHSLDLKHILSFPITDVPLSIAHSDGSLMKTDKSALLRKLEARLTDSNINSGSLPSIDVTLIDGGLLFHTILIDLKGNYGAMARAFLERICAHHGNEIHVLFDVYKENTIKANERQLRGSQNHTYIIAGPEQTPNQSKTELVQNSSFKQEFAKFLLQEWSADHYVSVLRGKKIVVSHGGNCCTFTCNELDNSMQVSQPVHLQGQHEEADTLFAYHSISLMGNLLIRACDTDIVIILITMLAHATQQSRQNKHIYMDCGTGNNRRLIDISKLFQLLEEKQDNLTKALAGIHAFTGCDFTSAFYRKGKVKPLQLVENDTTGNYVKAFTDLATLNEPDVGRIEAFVSVIYGQKTAISIDETRYRVFRKMSGTGSVDNPLKNVKKINCSLLPPCSKTLYKKIKRAQYVSMVWTNATSANPTRNLDPTDYGWKLIAGQYEIDWYDNDAIPSTLNTTLEEAVSQNSDSEVEQWTESDNSSDNEDL